MKQQKCMLFEGGSVTVVGRTASRDHLVRLDMHDQNFQPEQLATLALGVVGQFRYIADR